MTAYRTQQDIIASLRSMGAIADDDLKQAPAPAAAETDQGDILASLRSMGAVAPEDD